MNHLALLNGK